MQEPTDLTAKHPGPSTGTGEPTCLKTTNTLGNAQSGPGWPKRGTEVPCTTQEH